MEPETVRVGLFYVVDLPTEFKVYNDKKNTAGIGDGNRGAGDIREIASPFS